MQSTGTVHELTSPRDLRIDFFRGVALLIVLVDHIEEWAERPVIETWMLISLGFSDAAEIFVFLSGFVFAVAYSRTLDRFGFFACFKKAVRRALQIYIAYLLASWTVIAVGALAIDFNPPTYYGLMLIGERPWESVLASLSLQFHPFGFDILAMYVPILPAMALLLYVHGRWAPLAWTLSTGVYLAVQWNPNLNLIRFGDGGPWYFNPLAWQFLFFIGMALGSTRGVRRPIAPRWWLMALSIAMLAYGFYVLKITEYLIRYDPNLYEAILPVYQFYRTWGDKTTLAPLRLLHFFALAYVVSQLLPSTLSVWSSRWLRPIVVSGQHSLEAYAFGLVLSFFGVFAITQGLDSIPWVLMLDAIACIAMIGFAYGIHAWKSRATRNLGRTVSAPDFAPGSHAKTRARQSDRS